MTTGVVVLCAAVFLAGVFVGAVVYSMMAESTTQRLKESLDNEVRAHDATKDRWARKHQDVLAKAAYLAERCESLEADSAVAFNREQKLLKQVREARELANDAFSIVASMRDAMERAADLKDGNDAALRRIGELAGSEKKSERAVDEALGSTCS